MIGSLRGTLRAKQAPWLVIDVGGVGYELEVPMSTYFTLPAVGSEVALLTHLAVREDAHLLFGFATPAERSLFRQLIRISGVGARVALAILSGISVEGFARCIEFEDTSTLTRVPGIGKKTAERLIVEMRGKLGEAVAPVAQTGGRRVVGSGPLSAESEATSALLALGYKGQEVARLMKSLDTSSMSAEDIIRQALRQAAGSAT